jgi:hypothetical protein
MRVARIRLVGPVVFFLSFAGQDVAAQVCASAAPFANGRVRVGAAATNSDGANAFWGQASYGQAKFLYGTVFGGRSQTWSGPIARDLGGSVGYQLAVMSTKVEACPRIGASSTSYKAGDATTTASTVSGGVSVGYALKASDRMDFYPSLAFDYQSMSVSGGGDSETRTVVSAGTAFVVGSWALSIGHAFPSKEAIRGKNGDYWTFGLTYSFMK